jgi:SAM-dependent methyltransferase
LSADFQIFTERKAVAKPTYLAERIVENRRLAYYLEAADADFWDNHWKTYLSAEIYAWAETGALGYFEEIFTSYLPRAGRILEAGCGLGQYVLALRGRGYDVEGADWASEIVETVRAIRPDLPIRVGDVARLEVADGYYSGYISLGVVEHRREGPEPFLQEAYRVLEPGGVAFISVPYFHPLRLLKARLGIYRGRPDDLEFYQYAFTETEFAALLQEAGFKIIDRMLYAGFKGVKDEIPLLRQMFKWRGVGQRLQRWLQSWEWAERNLGHMILFVCERLSS